MQIEIIGSSSSGKTTFGKELVLACKAEGILIEANKIGCAERFGYSALALNKSPGKPKWLRIFSVLLNDFIILPRIIAQLVSNPRLYSKLFLSCLRRHDTIFKRINLFRNLIKRNTAYAMIQSKNKVHNPETCQIWCSETPQTLFFGHKGQRTRENVFSG